MLLYSKQLLMILHILFQEMLWKHYQKLTAPLHFMKQSVYQRSLPKENLSSAITTIMVQSGDESSADAILNSFENMPLSEGKFQSIECLLENFLAKSKNMDIVKRGVDDIVAFRDAIPETYKSQTDPFINGMLLRGLAKEKIEAGLKDQADYIISKLPEDMKKGF